MTLIHNQNSLSSFFTKIENLRTEQDKKLMINVYGDSTSVGFVASSYSDWIGKWKMGYVGRIREQFKNIFGDVGLGVIQPNYLWTYTGTWSTRETDPETSIGRNYYNEERCEDYGFIGTSKQTNEENATATLTFNGTGFDLYIQQDENGGTATVTIDDEPVTGIDCSNTTSQPTKISYTELEAGDHTIVITKSDDNKMIYLLGGQEIKGDYGVIVNNMSQGGAEIRNIESQNLEIMAHESYFNADLTIINLIINGRTINTVESYLSQLETILSSVDGDVLIIIPYITVSETTTNYFNAVINYADVNNIPLIDLYSDINGDYSYLYDANHPNIAGHILQSKKILSMIMPSSLQTLIPKYFTPRIRHRLHLN